MKLFSDIKSIQGKIMLWAGLSLFLLAAIIIGIAALSLRNAAQEAAEQEVTAVAENEAARIEAGLNQALDAARTLAQALMSIKSAEISTALSRDQVNAMLRQVLEENPQFLGTYTLWEPNAFDGLDSTYVNTEAHDETGRFIPYWVRDLDNNIHVEALLEYETPGIGDWYLLPKSTQREQVLSPFFYPIGDQEVLLSSFVAPIVVDGEFFGITGVDLRVDFLQHLADDVNLQEKGGKMAIVSSEGTLAGVTGQPELVGEPGSAFLQFYGDIQPRLQTGEKFSLIRPEENLLLVFVPIHFGNTNTSWYTVLTLPLDVVNARPTATMWQLIGIGVILTLAGLTLLWFAARQIAQPVKKITQRAQEVAAGDFDKRVEIESQDEIGHLAVAFNSMTDQLQNLFYSLEEQVRARTAELTLSMEVGQRAAAIRNVDELLPTITEFIRARFDLYYTHVYFVDDIGENLIIQAGTGAVGEQLLARRHSLPVGPGSIVGRVAAEGRSIVVPDTAASDIHKPNPLLPQTRSELAVPLLVEGRVLGVLDMQSNRANTFTEQNVTVFEAMATQLAIAIDSAQQWTRSQEAQRRSEEAVRQLTREVWAERLSRQQGEVGFVYDLAAITPLERAGETIAANNGYAVPLVVQNQPIGRLSVAAPADQRWSAEEEDLLAAVAQQLAQKAENLRLFEQTQERASREQLTRQIADKIRASRDIETALKIAAAELSRVLGTSRAVVDLQLTEVDETSSQ